MNKFIILLLLSLIVTSPQAHDRIFISPKIALKMIGKKETTFIHLNDSPLKIKKSKNVDIKTLKASDILGRTGCSPLYVCREKIEKYLSSLGIEPNQGLVIYDDSYGIDSATLYVVLESMGHKHMNILRGTLKDISELDPNWQKYNNYLNELKAKDLNKSFLKEEQEKKTELLQKVDILKPHVLLEKSNANSIEYMESNYTITKISTDYLLSREELKQSIKEVRSKESNITIIDACEMIDIVGATYASGRIAMKSLSWKELIDKNEKYLKSNKELEEVFDRLKLKKNEQHYVYCMSGAEKAFYMMMVLRELGYHNVKAFTGDWNRWVGDIDE
ncbi:MAG: Sulfurtransferase [uncultured Sulfurovum sp.]|uniref:Sulfurtransferase n=1 Tax=uncultured Sulfurovum sp. TaxID=269237 RepID=A0A6S6TQX6_9BACT|nr:MAG: Sulfurtransferase [uncultured Sulfurovum sp.]